MLRRDDISMKITFEYDLSCIIRKDDIFSPVNMILSFRQKIKDNLSQKIYENMIFSKKMFFPKKTALEYDLSCMIRKDGVFSLKI